MNVWLSLFGTERVFVSVSGVVGMIVFHPSSIANHNHALAHPRLVPSCFPSALLILTTLNRDSVATLQREIDDRKREVCVLSLFVFQLSWLLPTSAVAVWLFVNRTLNILSPFVFIPQLNSTLSWTLSLN